MKYSLLYACLLITFLSFGGSEEYQLAEINNQESIERNNREKRKNRRRKRKCKRFARKSFAGA